MPVVPTCIGSTAVSLLDRFSPCNYPLQALVKVVLLPGLACTLEGFRDGEQVLLRGIQKKVPRDTRVISREIPERARSPKLLSCRTMVKSKRPGTLQQNPSPCRIISCKSTRVKREGLGSSRTGSAEFNALPFTCVGPVRLSGVCRHLTCLQHKALSKPWNTQSLQIHK